MDEREFLIKLSILGQPYRLQLMAAYFIAKYKRIPYASEAAIIWQKSLTYAATVYEQLTNEQTNSLYRKNSSQTHCLTILDAAYPPQLAEIYHPPVVLYYQGSLALLKAPILAIVGARQNSNYALTCLQHLLPDILAKAPHLVTVSGLANGVDMLAHSLTLLQKRPTIAVLGTGLNLCYPKQNHALQKDIAQLGLVLSEYPLDSPPLKFHFPKRNRIIAGLCQTVLVVEAKKRSGSLITANLALQENRNVLAIPGRIDMPLSQGTNELILAGAKPVLKAEDVLEEIANA